MFKRPSCLVCHHSINIAKEWDRISGSRAPFILNCYGIRCDNCRAMLAIRPQRYNFALCLTYGAAILFIFSLDKLFPQFKGPVEQVQLLPFSLALLSIGLFLFFASRILARLLRLGLPTGHERETYKPLGWEIKGLLLSKAGKIQVNTDEFYVHEARDDAQKDWVCPQCNAKGPATSPDFCNRCGWRQIWKSDLE